jgi:hypothetical protein
VQRSGTRGTRAGFPNCPEGAEEPILTIPFASFPEEDKAFILQPVNSHHFFKEVETDDSTTTLVPRLFVIVIEKIPHQCSSVAIGVHLW